MDWLDILNDIKENYSKLIPLFTKEDENYQCLKTYRRGRLHGIFTFDYYKRKRLFKEGIISYSYIFKSYQTTLDEKEDFSVWFLHSPKKKYEENPELFVEIVNKINEFILSKPKNRKEKKLLSILLGELSEPKYLELPKDITNGDLVYLSSTYIRNSHTKDFKLGVNLIILAPSFTKEIFVLPDAYMSTKYKKHVLRKDDNND